MNKGGMKMGPKGIAPDNQLPKGVKIAVLRRISKYLLMHKGTVLICFLLMITSNVLALAAPKLSQKAIDAIAVGVGKIDIKTVIIYCAMMLAFYTVTVPEYPRSGGMPDRHRKDCLRCSWPDRHRDPPAVP